MVKTLCRNQLYQRKNPRIRIESTYFKDLEIFFFFSVTACLPHFWFALEHQWITVVVERKRRILKKTSTRKLKTNLSSETSRGNPRALPKTRQRRHNHLRRNQNSKKPWKPSPGAAAAIWTRVPRSHFIWASARGGRSPWSTRPRWTGTATAPQGWPPSSTSPAQTCWGTSPAPTTGSCPSSSLMWRWGKIHDFILSWNCHLAPRDENAR